MRCLHVLGGWDGSGFSGLFTSLKCEFLALRLPGLHSCIFVWFWIGRGSEHVAVVKETLGVLVYITTNIQKQEQTEAERHTITPPPPQPHFHNRHVQVHSVYKSVLATLVFQRKYEHALLTELAWSGLASVEDANWNRLSLKWDRMLVDWYQARIRASVSTPSLPSALNTFYQVPCGNKTGPRTHQLALLPASEDTVTRRNRKGVLMLLHKISEGWRWSWYILQIFDRIKLRLQAGLLTSWHVRFLHTNLWHFHSTGVCSGESSDL